MNQDQLIDFVSFYDMISQSNINSNKIWLYVIIFIFLILVAIIIYLFIQLKHKSVNINNNVISEKLDIVIDLLKQEPKNDPIKEIPNYYYNSQPSPQGYTAEGNYY